MMGSRGWNRALGLESGGTSTPTIWQTGLIRLKGTWLAGGEG